MGESKAVKLAYIRLDALRTLALVEHATKRIHDRLAAESGAAIAVADTRSLIANAAELLEFLTELRGLEGGEAPRG